MKKLTCRKNEKDIRNVFEKKSYNHMWGLHQKDPKN